MKEQRIWFVLFVVVIMASVGLIYGAVRSYDAPSIEEPVVAETMAPEPSEPVVGYTSSTAPDVASAHTEEPVAPCEPVWYYELEEELIRDFGALVYLEAGSCSRECQLAVASVILNRMVTRNSSFEEIAYAPYQFTPARRIKATTPSETSLECARYVLQYGPTIDVYVCFFRASFYFDWATPYMNVDNVYFSYDERVKAMTETIG